MLVAEVTSPYSSVNFGAFGLFTGGLQFNHRHFVNYVDLTTSTSLVVRMKNPTPSCNLVFLCLNLSIRNKKSCSHWDFIGV